MKHTASVACAALAIAFVAAGCSVGSRRTLSPPFNSRVATETGESSELTPELTGIVDELELCDLVTRGVRLRAEDVPAGAAIAITASSPADIETARRHAKTLEQALLPVGDVVAHRDAEGGGCAIADLAENDLSVRLDAMPDGMRLELTTTDPRRIDAIRIEARAFVEKARSGVTTEPGRAPP